MGHAPISLENLQNISGLDIASLQVRLLDLELAGQIARMPGGNFQRVVST
jgi:DNA processing protein